MQIIKTNAQSTLLSIENPHDAPMIWYFSFNCCSVLMDKKKNIFFSLVNKTVNEHLQMEIGWKSNQEQFFEKHKHWYELFLHFKFC